MKNSSKSQRLKKEIQADVTHSKQKTIGNFLESHLSEPTKEINVKHEKRIEITDIVTSAREDELVLKVSLRLMPSRTSFSKVTSELYFDDQKLDILHLRIIQGPLSTNDSEFSFVLDMRGISEGRHSLRVEMYELWATNERLTCTSKDLLVDYVPFKREDRLVRVPIVRSARGVDLAVLLDSDKNIYREIQENMKREEFSKRDEW
jgi:hypothetical protein